MLDLTVEDFFDMVEEHEDLRVLLSEYLIAETERDREAVLNDMLELADELSLEIYCEADFDLNGL